MADITLNYHIIAKHNGIADITLNYHIIAKHNGLADITLNYHIIAKHNGMAPIKLIQKTGTLFILCLRTLLTNGKSFKVFFYKHSTKCLWLYAVR